MKYYRFKNKKLLLASEDCESKEDATGQSSAKLKLQVVHPGKYVTWNGLNSPDAVGSSTNLWDLKLFTEFLGTTQASQDVSFDNSQVCKKYEDPMLNIMWKEVQAQKQVHALLDLKLEQDRIAWLNSCYKLTSLEGKGEAELIRLLFVCAGEHYEDERITPEQWEDMKPNTPYFSLPVLSRCGKQWGNTGAIARVLARKLLLMGVTNHEHLVVEATYERLCHLKQQNERAINWVITAEKNKDKQEWAQSQLLHVVLPPVMKEWEQLITKTTGPFVVASGVTLADLAIMDFLDQCSSCMMIDHMFSDYLAVADLYSMVRQHPKISDYLDERPED